MAVLVTSAIGYAGKCILVPLTLVITGSSEAVHCCVPVLTFKKHFPGGSWQDLVGKVLWCPAWHIALPLRKHEHYYLQIPAVFSGDLHQDSVMPSVGDRKLLPRTKNYSCCLFSLSSRESYTGANVHTHLFTTACSFHPCKRKKWNVAPQRSHI